MYSEALLEHFRNPRNVGDLPEATARAEVTNPACGDEMRLSARFEDDIVREAAYKVRGCTASIASGSALTEWMIGRTREELRRLEAPAVEALVGGLPAESRHAAALCVDAIRRLLK